MKKFLLASVLMWTGVSFAQGTSQVQTVQEIDEDSFIEEAFLPFKDMKIFHDKIWMYDAIKTIQEQQEDILAAQESAKVVRGVFNEKDSATLEGAMQKKNVDYVVTDDLLVKATEQPFEAYKDLLKTAKISKLSRQEMKNLNTVDKKAIPKMIQMMTESGPDIGAKPVSVIYDK